MGEAHACNVHTQTLEDRGKFMVPGLSRETLPQNKGNKKEKKERKCKADQNLTKPGKSSLVLVQIPHSNDITALTSLNIVSKENTHNFLKKSLKCASLLDDIPVDLSFLHALHLKWPPNRD